MQRYFAIQKQEKKMILKSDDIYHIKVVMRMKDKDEITVVYEEVPYLCCLENVNQELQILIKKKLEKLKDEMPKITLIIPLLKEQKMDFIFQKATELGVSKFIPYKAERSIIKLEKAKEEKKIERWRRIVKEASEQSFRTNIPEITTLHSLDDLKGLKGISYLCSTREKNKNIKNMMKKNRMCDRINLVIGPEGGLSLKEEQNLENIGFIPISLGNRIMRVETVPLFLLSVINFEYME